MFSNFIHKAFRDFIIYTRNKNLNVCVPDTEVKVEAVNLVG